MAALLEVKGAGVAGEWPCVVRYDPRGSGARHGRSRESGDDFGRRKGKVLPVGPAGQRDREGCGDAGAAGLARGRGSGLRALARAGPRWAALGWAERAGPRGK